MTPSNLAGQFGDTTYTKVFVGGLAWETQKETMKKYFEQFGEILEAVVIADKATGRSKGYGFVTFREPDAAMRACVDAAPVIDGRRANCNLASLGVQRSKPSTPKHAGRNFRVMSSFQTGFGGGVGTAFPSAASFPHYAIQQGIPYNVYGYSSYSPDYTYPAVCRNSCFSFAFSTLHILGCVLKHACMLACLLLADNDFFTFFISIIITIFFPSY
ncbi:hypothetical protein NC652_032009 [Populus alba x Populus x berolinensis]|nr:hypothetical protein NC652_032009 [Populus alba x Populus x berolinensis]